MTKGNLEKTVLLDKYMTLEHISYKKRFTCHSSCGQKSYQKKTGNIRAENRLVLINSIELKEQCLHLHQ